VAVLVEHGAHGSTAAAPIARDIIKRYYEKRGLQDKKQYRVDYQRYDLSAPVTAATATKPAGDPSATSPPAVADNRRRGQR